MGREGNPEDFTYDELSRFPIIHPNGRRSDFVVRLEDFLRYLGSQDVTLALELKTPDVEADTYALVKRFGLEDKVIVTSFNLDYLIKLKELHPDAKLGYLTEDFDDALLAKMREIGIGQLCPRGTNLTPEKVALWHEMGFNVRAWGIKDTEVMKNAYDFGVDGMTVNFPDRLIEYIIHKG
jgi:glycerophosphoryl diester phosphodiesterase